VAVLDEVLAKGFELDVDGLASSADEGRVVAAVA
jgi:hypothetical protein